MHSLPTRNGPKSSWSYSESLASEEVISDHRAVRRSESSSGSVNVAHRIRTASTDTGTASLNFPQTEEDSSSATTTAQDGTGTFNGGAWRGSRGPLIFLFPTHNMKKWISKFFDHPWTADPPVTTITRSDHRLHVYAKMRSCGHEGHLVELERKIDAESDWLPIALIFDDGLTDVIILLQETQYFIAQKSKVMEQVG